MKYLEQPLITIAICFLIGFLWSDCKIEGQKSKQRHEYEMKLLDQGCKND